MIDHVASLAADHIVMEVTVQELYDIEVDRRPNRYLPLAGLHLFVPHGSLLAPYTSLSGVLSRVIWQEDYGSFIFASGIALDFDFDVKVYVLVEESTPYVPSVKEEIVEFLNEYKISVRVAKINGWIYPFFANEDGDVLGHGICVDVDLYEKEMIGEDILSAIEEIADDTTDVICLPDLTSPDQDATVTETD